jgi:hypothetical protein
LAGYKREQHYGRWGDRGWEPVYTHFTHLAPTIDRPEVGAAPPQMLLTIILKSLIRYDFSSLFFCWFFNHSLDLL